MHPLEPANSPTLSTGHKVGQAPHPGDLRRVHPAHRRPRPRSTDRDRRGRRRRDPDGAEARRASWGSAVGISSGANFLGALQVQDAARRRRGGGDGLPGRQQEVPEHRPAAARSRCATGLPVAATSR
ncbi:MAG: hypothetical protein MZV49_00250 [Rhodopseudomonas palustris]|nr:hypothetical protein [Rhodopseudomonas palustris]